MGIWGSITKDYTVEAGVGIALVSAILEGDRHQVEVIYSLFGGGDVIHSAAAAERLAVTSSGTFDHDLVLGLAQAHERRDHYKAMAVRRRDRFVLVSPAMRCARLHAGRQLRQYLQAAAGNERAVPARPAYASSPEVGLDAVFGVGYATALSIVHLAASTDRDDAELLTELRAVTAGERVLPPEVRPPA